MEILNLKESQILSIKMSLLYDLLGHEDEEVREKAKKEIDKTRDEICDNF